MNRGFRLLLGLECCSALANQFLVLAVVHQVIQQSDVPPVDLFWVFAALHGPACIMVPVAGSILDRVECRKVLYACSLGSALLVAAAAAAAIKPLFLLFCSAAAFTVLVHLSARSVMVTRLLHPQLWIRGNSLRFRFVMGANILGPAFSGHIVAALSSTAGLGAAGLLWIIAAYVGWLIPVDPGGSHVRETPSYSPGNACDALRNRRQLTGLVGLLLLMSGLGGLLQYGMPLWIRGENLGIARELGAALSVFNLGSFAGALAISRLNHLRTRFVAPCCFAVQGVSLGVLSISLSWGWLFAGGLLCTGWALGAQQIFLETRIQARSPSAFLGRIMTACTGLRTGAVIGSAALGVVLVRFLGIHGFLISVSAAFLAAAVCSCFVAYRMRHGS